MKACKNANRYKGLRAPTCNGGDPCDACKRKFRTVFTDRGNEFYLFPNFMAERMKYGHKGFKSEISKAFSGRLVIFTTYRGIPDSVDRRVEHDPRLLVISIGCMIFTGVDYVKLKSWALS